MKLYMKQKVFSWTDKFSVADEQGNSRYFAQGELFSWGKKLHIYDSAGNEAAFIRQKVFSWMPRYFVEINGTVVATIVKDFTFFRPSYHVEGLPWQVNGDFWAHDYVMHDGQFEIMRFKKAWFTWGDSYELEIFNQQDELLCLSVALAIDCAVAQTQNNH